MSVPRKFNFSVAQLLSAGQRLQDALQDPDVGPAVVARFTTKAIVKDFTDARTLLKNGGLAQATKVGDIGHLTVEQARALTEVERLIGGGRRSAKLAFPGNQPRLHTEFRVGEDGPDDLASILDRACTVRDGAKLHFAALAEHGWIAQDGKAFDQAIETLEGVEGQQEGTKDEKKDHTGARLAAANAYFVLCLSIQNAARLEYPHTRASEPGVIEARGRFLLDTFPPRKDAPEPESPTEPPADGGRAA